MDDLRSAFVDPRDAWNDDDASWQTLGSRVRGAAAAVPFGNEQELRAIREQCRALALTNEFAINGHENRISYVVGAGHAYRVSPKEDSSDAASLARQVQTILDDFVRSNHWQQRQQEIVRRRDRDGEAFVRLFVDHRGTVRVRFVEPEQVATPPEWAADPSASFGIQTDRDDVETILGYHIDGRFVDAAFVQHRKANVDANVKRGLPLFYPVRKNLSRAEKLLRNMSVVAGIQSAIAIIRKHGVGTRAGIEQFAADRADARRTASGRNDYLQRYAPGTILDTLAGTEYEFPAAAIDASRYVAVLQAELRAIAARLVMPEFMLSSDASNANYASTMVAEGPAVKMFQRLQQEMIEQDVELLWRVVAAAVEAGQLPNAVVSQVEIRGLPPSLAVRDRLQEARADEILVRNRAMSIETLAVRYGLDPERERRLIQDEASTWRT
jgi:capsid protein